jgi:hypothetical protein
MASHPIERLQFYVDTPEMAARPLAPERRKRARAQVHWQVCFSRSDARETVHSTTRDLSSDGFYCIAPAKFVIGETRECTLVVPTHHPSGGDPAMPVLCKVRVVRAEALGEDGFYGVGCQIEDYRFVNSGVRR